MTIIPKLEELLQEKTVIILGAGASKDYGFPLWGELVDLMQSDFRRDQDNPFSNHNGADYWLEALQEQTKLPINEQSTVDALAANADDSGLELFQFYIFNKFLELESLDRNSNKQGWIEVFADKYVDLVKRHQTNPAMIKKVLDNLSIISFNYERSFAWRFNGSVNHRIQKVFVNRVKRKHMLTGVQQLYNTIYHPHGCLGEFSNDDYIPNIRIDATHHMTQSVLALPYGGTDKLIQGASNLDAIIPLDLIQFGAKCATYSRANSVLSAASNVVIIGMSELGIRGMSSMQNTNFLNLKSNKNIYYSGNEMVYDNFIPLDKYADEIMASL